jgi:phage-related protein
MTEQNVTPVFDGNDVVNTICGHGKKDQADEFLRTLDQKNQAKFQRYLERLRDGQQVKSPENMRHIKALDPQHQGAEVHELKVHRDGGLRLYLVRFVDRWYITHGAKKASDRQVLAQAERAFRIFWGD